MRTLLVVVTDVLPEDSPGMALAEHQDMVQTLSPCRSYEALGKSVRAGGLDRATMPVACWARNSCHEGPSRRGAGGKPCRRSSEQIAVAETETPSFLSSPWMRRQPQRVSALASRRTSVAVSGAILRLPGRRLLR